MLLKYLPAFPVISGAHNYFRHYELDIVVECRGLQNLPYRIDTMGSNPIPSAIFGENPIASGYIESVDATYCVGSESHPLRLLKEFRSLYNVIVMNTLVLPQEVVSSLSSEIKDFAVKAGRAQPLKTTLFYSFFSIVWLGFTSIFVVVVFVPVLMGREVHFEANGVPTVAGPGNLEPLLMPALIVGLFVLIGLGMFVHSLVMFGKKGGYYVGTPTRLIIFQDGVLRSIDWEQFSGDIYVTGNAQKGDLGLQLRTGRMVSQKNSSDRYVPDAINISEITGAYEIEQICRRRIKENDPTLPSVVA